MFTVKDEVGCILDTPPLAPKVRDSLRKRRGPPRKGGAKNQTFSGKTMNFLQIVLY